MTHSPSALFDHRCLATTGREVLNPDLSQPRQTLSMAAGKKCNHVFQKFEFELENFYRLGVFRSLRCFLIASLLSQLYSLLKIARRPVFPLMEMVTGQPPKNYIERVVAPSPTTPIGPSAHIKMTAVAAFPFFFFRKASGESPQTDKWKRHSFANRVCRKIPLLIGSKSKSKSLNLIIWQIISEVCKSRIPVNNFRQ